MTYCRLPLVLALLLFASPALAFEIATPIPATSYAASNFALPDRTSAYQPLAFQTTLPLSLGGNSQDMQLARATKSTRQTMSLRLGGRGWQGAALDNEIHLHLPKALKGTVQAYATGGLSLNRVDTTIAPGLRYGGGLAFDATQKLNFKLGYTSSLLDISGHTAAGPQRQVNASLAYRF